MRGLVASTGIICKRHAGEVHTSRAFLHRFDDVQTLAEALIVNYLALPKEIERSEYLIVVRERHEMLIGSSRFLLGCKIFYEIRDGVAGTLNVRGAERYAVRVARENAVIVHRKVACHAGGFERFARCAF